MGNEFNMIEHVKKIADQFYEALKQSPEPNIGLTKQDRKKNTG